MTLPLKLTTPYVPNMGGNARLAPASGGGFRLSEGYRKAKDHAIQHIMVGASGHRPTEEPVSVTMRCFFPDRRKRDAPNTAKLVLDAAQGWIYEDDSQVHRLTVERAGVDSEEPRIEVTVREHSEGGRGGSG